MNKIEFTGKSLRSAEDLERLINEAKFGILSASVFSAGTGLLCLWFPGVKIFKTEAGVPKSLALVASGKL